MGTFGTLASLLGLCAVFAGMILLAMMARGTTSRGSKIKDGQTDKAEKEDEGGGADRCRGTGAK